LETHAILLTPCPVLVQIGCVGTNFGFSFQTISNSVYSLEYNDDLRTNQWQFLESLIGDGSFLHCLVPMTNGTHRFFRLRMP